MPLEPITMRLRMSPDLDPDASAGIAAVEAAGGTLSGSQKTALNTYIVGLKAGSLWTTFYGLYLMVGGTSGAHAVNWKTPGTYNVTWTNSPTQDANGVTGNGTTSYGICTGLTGNSVVPHLHGQTYYLRNNYGAASARCPMGFGNNAGVLFYMAYRNNNTANNGLFGGSPGSLMTVTEGMRTGTIAINRTSTTRVDIYQNGTSFVNNTTLDASAPPSVDMGLLAMNDSGGTPLFFAAANLGLSAVHSPHSGAQASAFNTLIQALQTAFGRQV